jgi:hypothetical protein
MNLFFYDIDDIDEIIDNIFNIIKNSLLHPTGFIDLSKSINKYYRKYYNIIFKNIKYKFQDLFNNNYDKIKQFINDYNGNLEDDYNEQINIINKYNNINNINKINKININEIVNY